MDGNIELRLVNIAQKVAGMYKDKIGQEYYKQLCDAIETCRDYYINGKKDWVCMYEVVLSDGGIWEYAENQHEEEEIQNMWILVTDILLCNCYLGCMGEDGITPEELELQGENIPAFVELMEKNINETIDYNKILQFWKNKICY